MTRLSFGVWTGHQTPRTPRETRPLLPAPAARPGSFDVVQVLAWAERYRRFWEESYDRLDEYLDEVQGRGREKGDGRKR